ncbi:PLP-dependent aminotransferase family protein [Desulfospira joergensenii]|uniref:aminotransferase-like domain-containing protein n=1 Tax=Desulfospira joergensenii TaxID=53329 RepID=UPI0003B2E2AE|nr:PLP-dependent aminotransferase family protein [Desulfospira joergensenii]
MGKTPKYQQVADRLARLIREGVFGPGTAAPSVRKLSRQWKVSISTVLRAYYLLEAQGLLIPRPRSGFYVSSHLPNAPPEPALSDPEPDPIRVGMRELITMIILKDTINPKLVQLGAGHPDPALCATRHLNRLMASGARRLGDKSGLYLPPAGSQTLRQQIARHGVNAGLSLDAEEIIVTAGCGEAVYLCLKAVCRPGDTVAVESPICFDVFQYLENLGLKALEIPTHPREGISLEALSFALDNHPVGACVVISNFNNPLGSCIPDRRKQALVRMLSQNKIPLIENDIFGDIHFLDRRPPSAKAFDSDGGVLWCGSFSKTLSPGLRIGWTAPGRFRSTVEWLKFSASLATATLPQQAVASFMAEGGFSQHLRKISRIYRQRVNELRNAVIRYFPPGIKVTDPMGGYLLWIELPETVDALALYKTALGEGIAITPGHLFSTGRRYHHFIRLNAANWSENARPAVRRLGRVIASMSG